MPAVPVPVLVVMGVSGSGKSTIGSLLASRLGWALGEADELHPPANIAKMTAGIPLDDVDRMPWLAAVAAWIQAHQEAGTPAVIPCSALRRRYRDVLRRPGVVFIHLVGDQELLGPRITVREGHFMPATLLDSQLMALEPPEPDETHLTVTADRPPREIIDEIVEALGLK